MARSAIVVGAGIMGTSTARGLHRRGWDVTVLDAGPVPNPDGSSGGVHRLIRSPYGAMRGYTAMIPPAYRAWDELLGSLGRPDLMTHTGMLAVDAPGAAFGADEHGGSYAAESATTLGALGLPFELLDAEELERRFPQFRVPEGATALFTHDAHFLRARAIVGALADRLGTEGVAVRPHTGAVAVDLDAGIVTLAEGDALQADRVVVAAGPWTTRLLDDAPALTPSRQVVLDLRPPAHLRAAWAAGPAFVLPPAYGIPPRDELPLKVSDHAFSMTGDLDDDRAPRRDELDAVLDAAGRALHDIGAYELLGARSCFYTVSTEERFVVAPRGERGALLAGFSGHGFKFGPLLGEHAAAAIAEEVAWADVTPWAAGERTELPGSAAPAPRG